MTPDNMKKTSLLLIILISSVLVTGLSTTQADVASTTTLSLQDAGSGDAGDTEDTATSITPGAYEGDLSSSDEYDWYTIDATNGTYTNFFVVPTNGADIDLSVYDSNGWIASSDNIGDRTDEVLIRNFNGDATLTIEISLFSASSEDTSTYDFYVTEGTLGSDAASGGDAPESTSSAVNIDVDGYYFGNVNGIDDDIDMYSLDLTAGDGTFFQFSHWSSSDDFDITIIDTDGSTEIISDSSTDSSIWLYFAAEADGTYYVEIDHFSGDGMGYSLFIGSIMQDDAGSGGDSVNSFAAATTLDGVEDDLTSGEESEFTGEISSSYGYLDDSGDLYLVEFSSEISDITITMTPPANADFDLEIFDDAESLIEGSYNTNGDDSVTLTESISQFYISVYSFGGQGSYTLTLSSDSAGDVTETPLSLMLSLAGIFAVATIARKQR